MSWCLPDQPISITFPWDITSPSFIPRRNNVRLRPVPVSGEVAGVCFSKCLLCRLLASYWFWPGCGLSPPRTLLPPAVWRASFLCVCQWQFGLIYRPLIHGVLDPTSAAGMAIPCVGGGSTWVVLHWWGSDVVLLTSSRSSGERNLQTVWRESAFRKCGSRLRRFYFYLKQQALAI